MAQRRRKARVFVPLFCAALLGAGACSVAYAQDEVTVEGGVPLSPARELLEITNASDLMIRIIDALLPNMVEQIRVEHPDISDEFLAEFVVAFREEMLAGLDDYMTLQVAIYEEHFTDDEIRELVDFYRTPVGQKTITLMPEIVKEAVDAGTVWGRETASRAVARALEKLQEEGLEL